VAVPLMESFESGARRCFMQECRCQIPSNFARVRVEGRGHSTREDSKVGLLLPIVNKTSSTPQK
jgi:hypothetical protein